MKLTLLLEITLCGALALALASCSRPQCGRHRIPRVFQHDGDE